MNPLHLTLAATLSAVALESIGATSSPMSRLATAPWLWLTLATALALAPLGASRVRWIGLLALLVCWQSARGQAKDSVAVDGVLTISGVVQGAITQSPTSTRFRVESKARTYMVVVRNGDGRVEVSAGDKVLLWGRILQEQSYRNSRHRRETGGRELRSRGLDAVVLVRQRDLRVVGHGSGGLAWRLAERVRRNATAVISARAGDRRGNAIASALATGDRSSVDSELARTLREAGIAHLLAVSGLHLAVVSVFAFGFVRRLWSAFPALSARAEPRSVAAVVGLGVAVAYTLVTGARPSTVRALVVASFVFGALATFRRARALDALGCGGALLILWRPAIVFDPSFQMSMLAALTLALAFEHRREGSRRWLPRGLSAVASLLFVAVLALLATAPTAISIYGELPVVGIVLNAIAVPLVELIVLPLALLGSALSLVSTTLGGVLIDASVATAGLIVTIAAAVTGWSPPFRVAPLSTTQLVLVAATLASLVCLSRAWGQRRRLRRVVIALVVAGAALCTSLAMTNRREQPTSLIVTFLDVGQGDAAVLEFPSGEVWLIDAGGIPHLGGLTGDSGNGPGRAVLAFLRERKIAAIDVAVISHAHPDHYLGLAVVGEAIPIRRLLLASADRDQERSLELRTLVQWLRVLGTEVNAPSRTLGVGAATVEFLAPRYLDRIAVDPVSSVNDNSLVTRVEYAGRSFLFAGDLEEEGEELVLEREQARLDVDVVKVNHHGSKTSSWPVWVAATSPRVAVISCGRRNRFGFPNSQVMKRWSDIGAEIYRTDQGGAVTVVVSPAGELRVTTVEPLPVRRSQ